MAYPISTSPYLGSNQSPAYTGIFIPTIWAGKLIEKFYDASVVPAISNTNYEGEITAQGDKVTIRSIPTLTIADYEVNQALTVQRPSVASQDLLIDKGKYWNAVLDDVMEVQADMDMMSMWASDASEQMKIAIDNDVLDNIAGGVDSDNSGLTAGRISGTIDLGVTATPVTLTNANVINWILRMGQALDEQNIPETGRWLVITPAIAALIKDSDLKDASLSGDGVTPLRNGQLGMIDRFMLYNSNLLPAGVADGLAAGETQVFAGHPNAITFASQLTNLETLRSESTFGTLMRGLQVYGFKVIDGTAIVTSVVD